MEHIESSEAALLCDRELGELHTIKLAKQTNERLAANELTLTRKASAASPHILFPHHHGTTSRDIYFGVGELIVGRLATRIKAGQGIEDDAEFWKLAAQLTGGVADIHRAGILH